MTDDAARHISREGLAARDDHPHISGPEFPGSTPATLASPTAHNAEPDFAGTYWPARAARPARDSRSGGVGPRGGSSPPRFLARALRDASDPIAGLQAYEAERRPCASRIVLANRSTPPDTIVARVEELTGGERFDDIDAVIARDALAAISERYKQVTIGDIQSVNC
jgi:hypothetical protein